jgi:hypothetical protein
MTGASSRQLPGSIPLTTRFGQEIPNVQDPDPPPSKAEKLVALLRKKHPFVIFRRPPSGQYNCHGLTFANRRTCILDPKAVCTILEDDEYRTIRLREVQQGDIAVFKEGGEISHTGIVLEVIEGEPPGRGLRNIRIISKWGPAGEYVHMVSDGPYSQADVGYWTERPT